MLHLCIAVILTILMFIFVAKVTDSQENASPHARLYDTFACYLLWGLAFIGIITVSGWIKNLFT